jgi:hypothetical protein
MKNTTHHYTGISAIESAHKGHFFDADSKRFFRPRISQDAYLTADKSKGYFTTSEQFVGSDGRAARRLYTLRVCDMATGDIGKVGEFQAYATGAAAKRDALKMANGIPL